MEKYEHHMQFFTATILNWKKLLAQDKYKQIIIDSLSFLVSNQRIKIYGFIIMPNHIHLLWLIAEELKREDVQRDFLKFTSQKMKFDLVANHPQVMEYFCVNLKDRKYQIWKRNPLSIDLYGSKMIEQKLDYMHLNPLQESWNLAKYPEDYYFSSARYYEKGNSDFNFLTHYKEHCG